MRQVVKVNDRAFPTLMNIRILTGTNEMYVSLLLQHGIHREPSEAYAGDIFLKAVSSRRNSVEWRLETKMTAQQYARVRMSRSNAYRCVCSVIEHLRC